MRQDDIRFNGKADTVEHHSARGKVTRNAGNFTRGSQLVTHEFWMWFAGVRIPFQIWLLTFSITMVATFYLSMQRFETQLVMMRIYSSIWAFLDFNSEKIVHLSLPNGSVRSMLMNAVPYNPYVDAAWSKAVRCLFGSIFISSFIAIPLTMWFVDLSNRRGKSILQERHERGAMLVNRDVLLAEVYAHNKNRFAH